MSDRPPSEPETGADDFARQAGERSTNLVTEFFGFLRYTRKWWLTPIIVALLLVSVLIVLASSAAAPFIYTLF